MLVLCGLVGVLVLGPVAYGDTIPAPPGGEDGFPPLSVFFGEGVGPPDHVNPPGLEKLAETHFRFGGTWTPPHGRWSVAYEIDVDPDPFVFAKFDITNNDQVNAQDFNFSVVLPITEATIWGTITGGSFSAALLDQTGNGAEVSSVSGSDPPPMYMATIDGSDFMPLLIAPQSFTVPAFGTQTFGPENFGDPIPNYSSSTNAISTIGIETNVRLSPGDFVSLVATFVVVPRPEPEPATMGLLAVGALTVLLKRRRRRA